MDDDMKIYILAAIVLILYGFLIYQGYKRDHDLQRLAIGVGLVLMASFFTGFSRTMIVYKPIMIAHIALTLLCWYAVARYILLRIFNPWQLFSPLATIGLFFLVAWYFKEA